MLVFIVCLHIRKNVFVQFMRVIFKEFLIVALRFMCNFAYFGFAFNRILLIGQNHPKFVETVGKWKMRKFFLVSGIISVAFSIVKGFKYRINYGRSEMNYPYNNEIDIWVHNSRSLRVYFFFSAISDIFNYVVLLIVSLAIDVYMLARLRKTLDEKLKREREMNEIKIETITLRGIDRSYAAEMPAAASSSKIQRQSGKKQPMSKKELDMKESMNNAIRMVITNSLLNVAFKFPLALLPLVNVIVAFETFRHQHKSFWIEFNSYINETFTISFVSDLADFLFLILISIQLFFYIRFDLKMKTGFRRILND